MMANIDFEEKVDIDDLVFPSKPMEMAEIEINDIKQEPLEEAEQYLALKSGHDIGNEFKLKMDRGKYFPWKSSWFPLDLKLVPHFFNSSKC